MNNNTNVNNINNNANLVPTVSYLANFYKNREEVTNKMSHFFSDIDALAEKRDSIVKLKKELLKAQKLAASINAQINEEYNKVYSENFDEYPHKIYVKYESNRWNSPSYFFTYPGGIKIDPVDIEPDAVTFEVDKKRDEIWIPIGYAYDILSVIVRRVYVSISNKNEYCKYTDGREEIFPIVTPDKCYSSDGEIGTAELFADFSHLENINGRDFIKKIYDVDRELPDKDLKWYYSRAKRNKSFEIIIKTAPEEITLALLNKDLTTALPVYKILGVDQRFYNLALEKIGATSLMDMSLYFSNPIFNKTPEEWLEYIEMVNGYTEDLKFYCVDDKFDSSNYYNSDYGKNVPIMAENRLICYLCHQYANNELINKNYSLSKFSAYVIDETIQQGFASVKEYVNLLKDYLNMIQGVGGKATLYTSFLHQSHDIARRNLKVAVSEDEELVFKNRYADFEDYKDKKTGFMVIAPKNSKDITNEGNFLGHCVSSYIKKVIDGVTKIYFLRKKADESLVTLEICNGNIKQAYGACNRYVTDEEDKFLQMYAEKNGLSCGYVKR